MQDRDHAKAVALLVGVVALLASLAGMAGHRFTAVCPVGVGPGCGIVPRLLHPLVHVGLLHAVANVYVLWQLVFFCDIRCRHLLGAFVVACCCPSWLATWPYGWMHPGAGPTSVVGLSGVVFALVGMQVHRWAGRWRCCALLLLWQVLGLCVGTVAVGMHLYCFVAGVALAGAGRVTRSR